MWVGIGRGWLELFGVARFWSVVVGGGPFWSALFVVERASLVRVGVVFFVGHMKVYMGDGGTTVEIPETRNAMPTCQKMKMCASTLLVLKPARNTNAHQQQIKNYHSSRATFPFHPMG